MAGFSLRPAVEGEPFHNPALLDISLDGLPERSQILTKVVQMCLECD